MARKRIIDPGVWDDPDVQALAPVERLLFIGLFSLADDYGHISANPSQLRKWIFGYDEFTVTQAQEMRDHIVASCHNVHLYTVADQEYIWLSSFTRQQDLRWRAKAQYPCHACGQYHAANNWGQCKDSPVNAEGLATICAVSTQDSSLTLRTRGEGRGGESSVVLSNPVAAAEASAERATQSETPKPTAKSFCNGEDRQFWAVMAKVHHFAPNDRNKNARSAWNEAIAVLRAAGAKPDEYPEIYQAYTKVYPGGAATPTAIAKYVDQLVGIVRGTVPLPEREPQRNNRRPEPTVPLEYVDGH